MSFDLSSVNGKISIAKTNAFAYRFEPMANWYGVDTVKIVVSEGLNKSIANFVIGVKINSGIYIFRISVRSVNGSEKYVFPTRCR